MSTGKYTWNQQGLLVWVPGVKPRKLPKQIRRQASNPQSLPTWTESERVAFVARFPSLYRK